MQKGENNEEKLKFKNPLFEKILDILKTTISAGEIETLEKKYSFKEAISKIIQNNKKNRDLAIFLISEVSSDFFKKFDFLHIDQKLVKLAILKDTSLFFSISTDIRQNPEIGLFVVEGMVREGKNFFEIEKFIETYFPKNKKQLFNKYYKILEIANNAYSKDVNKSLVVLKKINIKLYDKIIKVGVVINNGNKLEINKAFISEVNKNLLEDINYSKLNKEEKYIFKKTYIENLFGINIDLLNSNERYLFDSILKLLSIDDDKKKILKKDIKEENNIDKDEEKNIKNTENAKIDKKDDFCDLAEFSYPECNTYSVSGGYNIKTITGKNIFISTVEKEKFTTKALLNFVIFYNTLYNLGLNFLWDKYSYDFNILCNNKVGFDYTSGEGITESKIVSILNIIGKNIGIPETKIIGDNGKEKSELRCFKTLGDAKHLFNGIKETNTINGTLYSDGSMNSKGAVENKLIEAICIDENGNGLNISRWK